MAKKIETQADLKNIALFYCSKRETSHNRLKKYLQRKCRESELNEPIWIEEVLNEFVSRKIVDDKRYTDILIREYTRRGKGKRYVEQKLKERGIDGENLKFSTDLEEESVRALEMAEKQYQKLARRLGKIEELESKPAFAFRQKLLQKLLQNGFAMDISRSAVEKCIKNQQ